MELALVLVLMVAVPVIALVWTRRGRGDGEPGTDPQAHRDIGAGGHPEHARGSEWGGGGSNI